MPPESANVKNSSSSPGGPSRKESSRAAGQRSCLRMVAAAATLADVPETEPRRGDAPARLGESEGGAMPSVRGVVGAEASPPVDWLAVPATCVGPWRRHSEDVNAPTSVVETAEPSDECD